jgi:hypothetical protein
MVMNMVSYTRENTYDEAAEITCSRLHNEGPISKYKNQGRI